MEGHPFWQQLPFYPFHLHSLLPGVFTTILPSKPVADGLVEEKPLPLPQVMFRATRDHYVDVFHFRARRFCLQCDQD